MKTYIQWIRTCILVLLFLLYGRSVIAQPPLPEPIGPWQFSWEMPPVKSSNIGRDMNAPIHIGTISYDTSFSDARNSAEYSSPYGGKGKDICYTFTIVHPNTTVFIDRYGSDGEYGSFDLFMMNPEGYGVTQVSRDFVDLTSYQERLPFYYSTEKYLNYGAFLNLEPGVYHLVCQESYMNSGSFEGIMVTNLYAFSMGPFLGDDFLMPIDIEMTCGGIYYTDVESTGLYRSVYGDPNVPDVIYRIELHQQSHIEISHPVCEEIDPSTMYLLDEELQLIGQSPSTDTLICPHISPGTYYIVNKAESPDDRIGVYVFIEKDPTTPGCDFQFPIDLGTKARSFSYRNSYESKHYSVENCPNDQGPSALYCKVDLQKNMQLSCTMVGREYQAISVFDANEKLKYFTDNSTGAKTDTLKRTWNIAHGTYYIRFETDGLNHPVDISIEGRYDAGDTARDLMTLDATKNYVLTTKPLFATNRTDTLHIDQGRYAIDYLDGFSRVRQHIDIWGSGEDDLIATKFYDGSGREDSIVYLPYARYDNSGLYRSDALSEQKDFYRELYPDDPDTDHTLSRKQYDAQGLVVSETAPGKIGTLHPLRHEYRLNTAGEIRRYEFVYPNGVVFTDAHAPGTLQVHVSWRTDLPADQTVRTYEYTDARGLQVATRVVTASSDEFTHCVYDDFGYLRYKIPAIADASMVAAKIYGPDDLAAYAYYYEYDRFGRQIKARIPGAEPICQLYDNRGRVAMKQTGNQRADGKNEWSFTKYDEADRAILTGICSGGTFEEHAAALSAQTVFGETRGTALHGYTNRCYPIVASENDVMTVSYYDDYAWLPEGSQLAFSPMELPGTEISTIAPGQLTGSKSRILGIDDDRWLTAANYYDRKCRNIQTRSELYPEGVECVSNRHDHSGNVVWSKVTQTAGNTTYAYEKRWEYDPSGRLLSVRQQIAGDTKNAEVVLASCTYDRLGRMTSKSIHNDAEQTEYAYRMNGDKYAETSPSFSYALGFDRPADTGLASRADGHMASLAWGYGTGATHGYQFAYDAKGQMSDALLAERTAGSWTERSSFREAGVRYDANGNITALQRSDAEGNTLHDLNYIYDGNRLRSILSDGEESERYAYDAEGNMTFDGLRGVNIAYNRLNLPERIFAGADEIRYIYSSNGTKLASVVNGSFTYYRNVMVFGQGSSEAHEELLYMLQPEGLVVRNSSGDWTYKYFKTDHLGNTRVLLAANPNGSTATLQTEQTTDYYPFGLSWANNDLHLNRYLYNGKELQDAAIGNLGVLGLYDFGARYYDPMLGRWFNIDPALQLMNPYLFCGNAPMVYVDENGEFFLSFIFGFFRGLFKGENPFKTGWNSVKNSAKLLGGLFTGNFLQILSRLTWELPQTALGLVANVGANWICDVDVDYAYGATVTRVKNGKFGAFTLGSYILGDKNIEADPSNSLFQHEYGHYLQSQAWGPFYMGKVAVPSLFSAMSGNDHGKYKTEQDANVRALKFWEKKFPGFYNDTRKGWKWEHNQILGFDQQYPFNSLKNQKALQNGLMKGIGGIDFLQVILPRPFGWIVVGAINY